METFRLLLFTTLWTAIWAAPLPKLSRRVELVAGLIPFAAFGLRVFGACFIGVPADDPVRLAVAPLVDWINGASGTVPYQWVLDATVAIGLVWFASIANIPRRWRLATIWVMPAVALASLASLRFAGLPLERLFIEWRRHDELSRCIAGLGRPDRVYACRQRVRTSKNRLHELENQLCSLPSTTHPARRASRRPTDRPAEVCHCCHDASLTRSRLPAFPAGRCGRHSIRPPAAV